MHRSEANELVYCLNCGAEVSLAVDRTFAVSDDTGICFDCAIKRGGMYDEAHDRWTRPPSMLGLPEPD